jgi:uncharacterized protein (TIGR02996 family)
MSETAASARAEHDAFLLAIHADREDAPRLIYADWLEDRGGEAGAARAEFIRAQVELANLKNRSKRRKAALEARQQELLAAYSRAWLGPWADAAVRWVFRRGVPERIVALGRGRFLGAWLGQDWGFPDRVDLDDRGRACVTYGDINWPGVWPPVDGQYELRFTYARAQLTLELWQVNKQTLRYEGQLTSGGAWLDLERTSRFGPPGGSFELFAPPEVQEED